MTASMTHDEATERRAALRMAAAGAFLGLAAVGLGLFLAWVVPLISVVVLLGYGLIVGGIFGALIGITLYRARIEGSPELRDLQRHLTADR
jgi:hypothetical protein